MTQILNIANLNINGEFHKAETGQHSIDDKLIIMSNAFCASMDFLPIYNEFARTASESGYNVLQYDYRGLGKSAGDYHSRPLRARYQI